ncbi:MAG: NAD(P)-binding domain-containing protein [Bacteroidales bacterium]|nr:NAD(P)-binding domain-containing protein [Bacteroidales bacterium]
MRKILITSKVYDDSFDLLKKDFELIIPETGNFTNDELIAKIVDCEVLLSMFTIKIGSDVLSAAPKLKMVSNFGVGFNNIDMKYADEHGIVVTNTPDPVTEPTAELAFGLMHSLCRRIVELDRDIRIKDKIKWGLMQNIGSTMTNKTLGIIGFGRIGQALARRAVAAKMNIVYYSRHHVKEEIENLYHAKYVPMNELLKMSDFVSLNTPLTAETTHLIGKEQLALMKKSAFLVNTSRGAVINEHELAEALRDNVIAGAGLDVYEKEPVIDPLLLSLNNVILVPHIGTATRETRQDTAKMACENILGFYAGKQDIHRCGKW